MLDGLDRDDIYIMVEDEFHAIARTFTQHLHHAEYLRLKSLAKTRNASTVSNISRPVDSITVMRAETKKKKEAENREAKNKTALEQLRSTAQKPRPTSEDSDFSELEGKDEGHWKGTALQGFMTTSPGRNQTSLAGLQSIKSSTRAAAGFSKAETKPACTSARPFNLAPKPLNQHISKTLRSDTSTTSEGSDDDLDAPITNRNTTRKPPNAPNIPRTISNPPSSFPPTAQKPRTTGKNNTIPPSPISSKKPRQSQEENISRSSLIQIEAAKRRLKARMAKEETDKKKRQEKKGERVEVDEIPVFLY